MSTLIWLVIGHYVGDFALQNDYVAKNKAPGHANWLHCMIAHCVIQAGTVYLVTGNPILAGCEFGMHFIIDVAKCMGALSFTSDQSLHLLCRIMWALVAGHLL